MYTTKNYGERRQQIASEPPAVGSHTTKPIHQKNQSEGGGNDRTYKGKNDTNEVNLAQSEDEDDLILGTPLGAYVLRTKGTGEDIGTHTLEGGARGKGKIHQGSTTNEDLLNQRSWEELKKIFEEQFSYEDSGFSGGSTHNNTDQEVRKPISQEKFDALKRNLKRDLSNSKTLELRPESTHHLPTTIAHVVLETIHPTQSTWLHHPFSRKVTLSEPRPNQVQI